MGAMVSMAANGAVAVKGGNYQIFQHFVNASAANLHLNSKVSSNAA
jgi:prenylcysteine oxidase/farnesylcysteine lyase